MFQKGETLKKLKISCIVKKIRYFKRLVQNNRFVNVNSTSPASLRIESLRRSDTVWMIHAQKCACSNSFEVNCWDCP